MVTTLETPGPGVKSLTLSFFAMTAIVSRARTWHVIWSWNVTELKFWGEITSAVKDPLASAVVCGNWLRRSPARFGRVGGVELPPRTVA